jgi:hypothetical protein
VRGGQSAPEAGGLVCNFVATGFPARRTVVKTIAAQADVDLSLAGATILFAVALFFRHLALHAAVFIFRDSGHGRTLPRA